MIKKILYFLNRKSISNPYRELKSAEMNVVPVVVVFKAKQMIKQKIIVVYRNLLR